MSIVVNGSSLEYKKGVKAIDLVNKDDKSIITCKVNNKLRDLSYIIEDNSYVNFLGFDDEDSIRVYEASLRFLLVMAVKRCYPSVKVECDYYISKAICFKMEEGFFSEEQFNNIKEEMKRIVEKDFEFIRKTMSLKEAIEYYGNKEFEDKVEVFKYRPDKEVHLYECDGYNNYMYSYMVPSTGYLNRYNLLLYKGMLILQYPRAEEGGNIPEFVEEVTYENTLIQANEWGSEAGSLTVSGINENALTHKEEFIKRCENRHDEAIKELGKRIASNDKIKLIAIAGPSSSGKTTFSNKLREELEKRGIFPVKISMDDYYKDRSNLSKDEEKEIDYEDINLIDIELFNRHLKELADGKEVRLPKFDFVSKKSLWGEKIKLTNNGPIIIEGIHALNEKLTASLARESKFEIYIGPHIQINLDKHNPISITHLRLIRRIIRDSRNRGVDVEQTLAIWEGVRRGEFKWIYDNQEGVDFVYNSALDYEFCVMKKYALPLLRGVMDSSKYYNLSRTLIKYLKYFVDIDDKYVPENSLLREFIGGSCYKD